MLASLTGVEGCARGGPAEGCRGAWRPAPGPAGLGPRARGSHPVRTASRAARRARDGAFAGGLGDLDDDLVRSGPGRPALSMPACSSRSAAGGGSGATWAAKAGVLPPRGWAAGHGGSVPPPALPRADSVAGDRAGAGGDHGSRNDAGARAGTRDGAAVPGRGTGQAAWSRLGGRRPGMPLTVR